MKTIHTQQGFTIIETLVAITILMISIAGPLTIAHKGLLAATYASDNVTASYLAQDAMEFVKNVRDNKKKDGGNNWLEPFSGCISGSSGAEQFCIAETSDDPGNAVGNYAITGGKKCATTEKCWLYKSATGYSHTSNNTFPKFERYFYIDSQGNSQAKIVVLVKWKTGEIENQVLYENEIFDIVK